MESPIYLYGRGIQSLASHDISSACDIVTTTTENKRPPSATFPRCPFLVRPRSPPYHRMPPSKSSHHLTVFLLRFLISKNEYERLEVLLSPYTPNSLRPHLPSTADFDEPPRSSSKEIGLIEAAIGPRDEFLPATVRQAGRVFAGTYITTTFIDVVLIGIIKKHRSTPENVILIW